MVLPVLIFERCAEIMILNQKRRRFSHEENLAAAVIVAMICGSAYAERFSKFPAYGICMGDSVRCRENPSKKSEIVKRINKGDEVQVVSQRTIVVRDLHWP